MKTMAAHINSDPVRISFLFRNLEGLWHLDRNITGIPGQMTMSGEGRFKTAENNILNYYEEGKLCLGDGQYYEAFRRYVYYLKEGTIRVYFNDGTNTGHLFHALKFASARQGWPVVFLGFHECSPDQYSVGYEFLESNKFRITYRVTGPRKNYVSTTLFNRLE